MERTRVALNLTDYQDYKIYRPAGPMSDTTDHVIIGPSGTSIGIIVRHRCARGVWWQGKDQTQYDRMADAFLSFVR